MPQKSVVYRGNKLNRRALVLAEFLESRKMLSAVGDPLAYPTDAVPLFQSGSSTPPGFSPTQIADAYGINNISFNGTAGTGAGQTIAIAAAYDNPDFVSSTDPNFDNSDLHKFDVAFNLPDPPSFTKLNQTGGTAYPPVDPNPTGNSDWENEIALDVEWSHAIAPDASIVLVEANSTSLNDLISNAAHYAATLAGVSVVTMSYTSGEVSYESNYDSYLETPVNHQGVTFVAASGDGGNGGGYPSMSPNVVSVGDTSLTLSGNNYGSETGQSDSGGGISLYETKPSFQYNTTQSTVYRTTPDVAFDGNPNTGVSVYDSYNGGSSPWYKVGGTSFSAPAWGALIAIADQGRAQLGLGTLDGASQTLPRLYALNSADFHDITTGNNGNNAGPGYDLVTGLGTPIANKLVSDLAGGNVVTGTVFNDANSNGTQDSGEAPLPNFVTYVDLAQSGVLSGVDFNATSDSSGDYSLNDLPGGTYRIRQTTPAGATLTTPSGYYSVTLGYGSLLTAKDFGYHASNAAEKLAYLQQPASAVQAGAVISPAITVELQDALGTLAAGNTTAVTLSLASGSGSLGGTVTENAVNGIATFNNVTISGAGLATIEANDGILTLVVSNPIVVSPVNTAPLTPAKLVFEQEPTSTIAGNIMTPAVTVLVEDASGNLVTTDSSSVTLAIGAGSAILNGTSTVNAVNGVATFSDLIITAAETTALTASDGTLTPATSTPVTITAAATAPIIPAQVVFTQQPTATQIGSIIAPPITVEVRDSNGRLVVADTSAVTLSIGTGTATLGGTLTVNAVAGVATFSDITLSAAGDFTLKASDGQLNTATSTPFTVSVPGTVVPSITHSTLPANNIAGAKVKSAVVVSNMPSVTAVGTVVTDIYASTNGTLTLLGTISAMRSVKAGKAYSVSVPIKMIPSTLVGTYSLIARTVDSAGNYVASSLGQSVTIAAPVVSFSESITRVTLPASVVAGSKTNATATVKITNSGNVISSGLTTMGIYASADGSTTGATLIATLARTLLIRPNASASVTIPLKLIPAALDGSFAILTEISNTIAGNSSANSGVTVNIAPPFVSLSSSLGTIAPTSLAAGKTVSIALTLTNAGNIDSTGLATINIGLSSDGTTELPGSVTTMHIERVPTGKTLLLHLKFTVPATTTAGMYFPFVSFSQAGQTTQAIGTAALSVG